MSVELKIKAKHLALEPGIIRKEEYKFLKQYQWSLNQYRAAGNNDMYPRWDDKAFNKYCSLNSHRKWDVRNEARATFLARAYIAGAEYSTVEQKRKPENEFKFNTYILPRVCSMVAKYGNTTIPKEIWEGSYKDRKKVPNPAFVALQEKIKEWSTFPVDK